MKKSLIATLLIGALSFTLNAQNNKSKSNSKTKSEKSFPKPSEPKANTFGKGQLDLNLGIGFGRSGLFFQNSLGFGYNYSSTPPLSASLDYGITKNISVGGILAFTRTKLSYTGNNWYGLNYYSYTDTYSWAYYIIGARAAFHFAEYIPVENLDVYGGVMLGNNFAVAKYSTTDIHYNRSGSYSSTGGFIWGLYAGARYRFTEKFGVFSELGYGLAYGTIGVNLKF